LVEGCPEFGLHILGQLGRPIARVIQCAGESSNGPYFFNQDNLDWSGKVLAVLQAALDQLQRGASGAKRRVFVVERRRHGVPDQTDPDRFQRLIATVDSAYRDLTAGNDSSTAVQQLWATPR